MKSIADIKAIRDKMQADKTTRETSKDGDVRIVVGNLRHRCGRTSRFQRAYRRSCET